MPVDISKDFLLFDGLASITNVQAGTERKQVIKSALRRSVTTRDAIGSDGTYQTADVKFSIPAGECLVFNPVAGDFIVEEDGAVWTIGMVDLATLRTRRVCWSKRAELNPNTLEEVRLEKGITKRDESGAPYYDWRLMKLVNAHVNEVQSEIAVEVGRRRTLVTHQIFVVDFVDVFAGWRVVQTNGTIYHVLRVTGKGNMGVATVLDVEVARTPVKD